MSKPHRTALGRGLSALIPDAQPPEDAIDKDGIVNLPLSQIRAADQQPRTRFDDQALQTLADSIQKDGLLQPIVVRKTGTESYTIIAGERRFRASRLLGLATVPTLIRHTDEEQSYELALIENIQRENLDPLEEAEAYRYLAEEHGMTQAQIAKRVGRDRVTVSNSMRILKLPAIVREHVATGELSAGHGRAILSAPDSQQLQLAERAIDGGWSVRQTEAEARKLKQPKPKPAEVPEAKHHGNQAIEAQLRAALGAPIKLVHKKGKGRIEIRFHSSDELERLIDILSEADQ